MHAIQQHHLLQVPPVQKNKNTGHSSQFKDLLTTETLKVSKHAASRLQERNISIDNKQWETISEKMEEAKQRGITDSLVVTNNAALLVSTKNHTVVTAMDREEATSRIFTNINGTILIND